MQNHCYKLSKIATCDHPLLPVEATYILTMKDSERLRKLLEQSIISQLARTTIVQINSGFKQCTKPGVSSPSKDLCHAYKNVFLRTTNMGMVLILEDDAMFDIPDINTHLRRVSDYTCKHNTFDIYSLGSFNLLMVPCSVYHRLSVVSYGSHAMIWTPYARQKILHEIDSSCSKTVHIDMLVQKHIRMHTYYRPIATQLLTTTENSSSWCISCADSSSVDNAYRLLVRSTIKILGLDTATRPSWDILFGFPFGCVPLVMLVILTAVYASVYAIRKHQNAGLACAL